MPRSIDVDQWHDMGLLFSLWQIPVDVHLDDNMTFLRMEEGRRCFFIWLLLKSPPCRQIFAGGILAGFSVQKCVQDAADMWRNLPTETQTGSS